MLEANCHEYSSFVTLTYDEEHLPDGPIQGSLVPKDLQDWLKRIRKACPDLRLRYYAVGEYGDRSERPHYHVALFGYPYCSFGASTYQRNKRSCCARCDLVRKTWGKGNILVGQLEPEACQYICGYVIKKMTRNDDSRLHGRVPEFARMSLRPGIGFYSLAGVASALKRFNLDNPQADVPSALRHGKKILPLGRYLRMQLRKVMGRDPACPQSTFDELQAEMLHLQITALDAKEFTTAKELLIRKYAGKIASIEARAKIMKKRGSI